MSIECSFLIYITKANSFCVWYFRTFQLLFLIGNGPDEYRRRKAMRCRSLLKVENILTFESKGRTEGEMGYDMVTSNMQKPDSGTWRPKHKTFGIYVSIFGRIFVLNKISFQPYEETCICMSSTFAHPTLSLFPPSFIFCTFYLFLPW